MTGLPNPFARIKATTLIVFSHPFLDSNQQSPQSKTKSNDDTCRFTRELEQRLQNGLFIFALSYRNRELRNRNV